MASKRKASRSPLGIRPVRFRHCAQELHPLVQLWALRILVPLGATREFVTSHGFSNDQYAEILGLRALDKGDAGAFNAQHAKEEIRWIHHALERNASNATFPPCLGSNIDRLAELVGLSDADCKILGFAVFIHTERFLDDVADWLGQLSSVKVFHALSVLLDIPEPEIRAALTCTAYSCDPGCCGWIAAAPRPSAEN